MSKPDQTPDSTPLPEPEPVTPKQPDSVQKQQSNVTVQKQNDLIKNTGKQGNGCISMLLCGVVLILGNYLLSNRKKSVR